MVFVNYYEVLGIQAQATEQDITSAYRRLALKYHPDKSGGDAVEKFLAVHKAYKVLSDPLLRREHDEKIQRHISINVDMKMSSERMQLYERLHKKKPAETAAGFEKKPPASRQSEEGFDAPYIPRTKTPQEFEEYERIILERMRAA